VANTYYKRAKVTAVKSFIVLAPEGEFSNGSSYFLFLFSDYLLELWDLEEKNRQKSKKVDNVADADADADANLFNDRQWKDQWYMVSSVDIFRATSIGVDIFRRPYVDLIRTFPYYKQVLFIDIE